MVDTVDRTIPQGYFQILRSEYLPEETREGMEEMAGFEEGEGTFFLLVDKKYWKHNRCLCDAEGEYPWVAEFAEEIAPGYFASRLPVRDLWNLLHSKNQLPTELELELDLDSPLSLYGDDDDTDDD